MSTLQVSWQHRSLLRAMASIAAVPALCAAGLLAMAICDLGWTKRLHASSRCFGIECFIHGCFGGYFSV